MPKNKKQKNVGQWGDKKNVEDRPSLRCKDFVTELIVRFYQGTTLASLDSSYVRYEEEGPKKFKHDMELRIMDALAASEWDDDRQKKGYSQFVASRAHDALWNARDITAKFAREHMAGDDAFNDVVLKAELFQKLMQPMGSRRHRRASISWWDSPIGMETEMALRRQSLIVISNTAIVRPLDTKVLRGGYATIKRVRIEGAINISPVWEFAAKRPLNHDIRPDLARVDHNNESLAVRIPHPGVIRFVAIHHKDYEGYMHWWNGGTLREMLRRDREAGDNLFIHYTFGLGEEDDLLQGMRLRLFRSKRTELAWALLNIMNEVHKTGNLHNDLSPDNILLHFPQDESKIYIGVCDWGLTSKIGEHRRSPWVFTNAEQKAETIARRYWVDPRVMYVHRPSQDIQIIPDLVLASEDYATAKIASRINKGNMSDVYYNAEPQPRTFDSKEDLARTFHIYLDRACGDNRGDVGGLSHVINRFRDVHKWPVPTEHYRHQY